MIVTISVFELKEHNGLFIFLVYNYQTNKFKADVFGFVINDRIIIVSITPLEIKIKRLVQLLDIKLLDHIIVTSEGYYSFADEGLI